MRLYTSLTPFQLMMAMFAIYALTITLVKISILTLYRRVFVTPAFKTKALFVGIVCLIWFNIAFFLNLFQCHHFKDAFDFRHFENSSYIDMKGALWGFAVANLGLDLVVLYLSIPVICKLPLPTRKKVYLTGCLPVGVYVRLLLQQLRDSQADIFLGHALQVLSGSSPLLR